MANYPSIKSLFVVLSFFFLSVNAAAQKARADSLTTLLRKEKVDSNRVTLMWQLASVTSNYDPKKALILSRQALYLAEKIKYVEGKSRSLGIIANTFINIGNYPRALEYYLEKLKLEEKRYNPRNLASVLMNIGVVYVYEEEYQKALVYYYKSDSVIMLHQIDDLKYYSMQNLGDIYDRLNVTDSAYSYFERSLELAKSSNDNNLLGASMTGLGHSYLKQGRYSLSLNNYQTAISYLAAADNDDLLCEALLGLAKLYEKMNRFDSAAYYARQSLFVSEQHMFLSHHLEAAEFLTNHFKELKNIDSAFSYLKYVKTLNDSIYSKNRIREAQIISSNEQLRQIEMEESRKIAQQERSKELQLLFIGIFIPGFFALTLLLSRIRIHTRVIKVLGILSLLIFFEYLTLLLHPTVLEITHHTPVLEMLIFVSIAAILIPAHHRIEHWLIEKLTHDKHHVHDGKVALKRMKLKMKKPSA